MTREQKLALILGFALVLVVGILVSDHLSGARRADLANNVSSDDGLTNEPPLPMPREGNRLAMVGEREPLDTPQPLTPDETIGNGEGERIELAEAPSGGSSRAEELIRKFGHIMGSTPPSASHTTVIDPETGLPYRTGEQPAGPGQGADESEPAPPPTVTPEVKTHVVAQGQTLWSIAQQHYGNGKYHKELAAYNASVVGKNGQVSAEAELKIPSLDALLGRAGAGDAADQPDRAATPEKARPEAKPAKARTRAYKVQKGDTLGTIAQKQLGTIKRMGEILELNKGLINDADDIRVGMELKLPARE